MSKLRILSGNVLKIIAAISMLKDPEKTYIQCDLLTLILLL